MASKSAPRGARPLSGSAGPGSVGWMSGSQAPGRDILVTTTNDVPGFRVTQVLGEVMGLTVRSRNIGSQIGAGLKALAGGELKGMTKNLYVSRQEVVDRMLDEARSLGANAVLAMRFDTSELGQTWTEICAYGTAAVIAPA